jgi:signal transduction histidine kinase
VLNDARTASIAPERVQISADPATNTHTDPQLLSVIVSNLIDNALKYGNNHTPVLLRLEPDRGSRKNGLRIVVTNAPGGAGVPDPKMVFKKYYRAPGAHGKTGSGLGLHISDGFATMLGGQLRYVPTPDAVEFTLWIPQP